MLTTNLLSEAIEAAQKATVSQERREVLQPLIDYISEKKDQGEKIQLNFICTHNSRRSQFSQVWAQTAADFYSFPVECYSGGVEVTAFNERAVDSIIRSGFEVSKSGNENPVYEIKYAEGKSPIKAFSKIYDDNENPKKGFAAIMTCSHADENCPFIIGADKRIPVRYEDPKEFDDTPQEADKYDERSLQIASEMFYVFAKLAQNEG